LYLKICIRCNEEKAYTEFHSGTHNSDGYGCRCKPCECEYRRELYARNKSQRVPPISGTRQCGTCGEEKSVKDFGNNPRCKDGLKTECKACVSSRQQGYRQTAKADMIEAYGGKCQCCGEGEPGFLTIDHVNGNGNKHRQQLKLGGWSFYLWLKKQGYPKGEYRLLCYNCNCSSHHLGECPHKRKNES